MSIDFQLLETASTNWREFKLTRFKIPFLGNFFAFCISNAFPISGSIFQIHESCFQLMEANVHSQCSPIFMTGLPNFGIQIHHNPEIHRLDFQFFKKRNYFPISE